MVGPDIKQLRTTVVELCLGHFLSRFDLCLDLVKSGLLSLVSSLGHFGSTLTFSPDLVKFLSRFGPVLSKF